MLSALLNRQIVMEYRKDSQDGIGDIVTKWVFYKRVKATWSVQKNYLFTLDHAEYVDNVTTFIIRYDEKFFGDYFNYRILFNGRYYRIRTAQEMFRREGLILQADQIENNDYGN